MSKAYLSIIIPCYNEARNIRLGALEKVAHFMEKQSYEFEVFLVDDGSTDDSLILIKQFVKEHKRFKLIPIEHQGKAGAVIQGIAKSEGDIILFSDLDQATPIHQINVILPWFRKGYDVVIGSRNKHRQGAPFFRLAMARGFMIIRNLILDLGIRDTQCGFKAFKKEVIKKIVSRLQLYNVHRIAHGSTVTAGFDVEMLFVAKTLGYSIVEVPVEWHYQETRHINPLKDSFEGLSDLIKIRINNIHRLYTS